MHSITNLIQLCYKRTFSITTLMKSFFLVPYSSNMPRGAAAGTKRMDLKVTSPSAVKWMWERGSSVSWGGGGREGGEVSSCLPLVLQKRTELQKQNMLK